MAKKGSVKIRDIKPKLKILSSNGQDENLEDEVEGMETERFASFTSQSVGAPVLRQTKDGEELEIEDVAPATRVIESSSKPMYSPRSSTGYTQSSTPTTQRKHKIS